MKRFFLLVTLLTPFFARTQAQTPAAAPATRAPTGLSAATAAIPTAAAATPATAAAWQKQATEPYRGKQDDICFVTPEQGWYVNGAGKIFGTRNGGQSWQKLFEKPGTFFRCVAFIDSLRGFAGNIGTQYFPGVTDTIPLYATKDGGRSWAPVRYKGPTVKGLCALDIVKEQFINAGNIDYRYHIFGGGRVGGPGFLLHSPDNGDTWTSRDLRPFGAEFILDIKMFNPREGFICAGSSPDVAKANALMLETKDGGLTWTKRYQSQRPYEITWKQSWPTRRTGYATVQSYNPDTLVAQRYVVKTTNGGRTWKELPLIKNAKVREFGLAFADEQTGWVGAMPGGFGTRDGGRTWAPVQFGPAVNKIRVVRTPDGGYVAYAIGVGVYKLNVAGAAAPGKDAPRGRKAKG